MDVRVVLCSSPDASVGMGKVATAESDLVSRIPKACADEGAAVGLMEEQRWGDTPNCPRCGDTDVVQMRAADGTRNARFLWRCRGCKQQYTVRVGTIMEDSPIPMRHWCFAFCRACSSKEGVSALQIQRETGLSYKSALFLMHRIRWAMAPANEAEPKLGIEGGTVDCDETNVGGHPRRIAMPPKGSPPKGKRFDFGDRKTPVLAGVERGGRVKARVVGYAKGIILQDHVRDMVDPSAHLMTDEYVGYRQVGKGYASHDTVRHSLGEYARGDVTTNRIEGCFAGLKRQINGTHHAVSKKHLHRYVSEVEFKYNNRNVDDGERTTRAIQAAVCKRLTYKQQVGHA